MDYFTYMMNEALQFLLAQPWWRLFRLYWFFIIFDFARYGVPPVFLLLKVWLSDHNSEESTGQALLRRQPLVSVIVPGYNEENTIPSTIASIYEQTYQNLEIIIVNDGSTDRTGEVCRKLAKKDPRVRFFQQDERSGKASACNLALNFCRGEFIIHVDSDTSFHRDSFVEILKKFSDPQVGLVGGNILVRNSPENLLTRLQDLEYLISISMGRQLQAWAGILHVSGGAFTAFRTEAIRKFGGWDVGPGEDADITVMVRKLGFKVAFAPKAIAYTKVPRTVWGFIKQRIRWDRSVVRLRIRKHADVYNIANANFMWSTFMALLDSAYFIGFLTFLFFIYAIDLYLNYYEFLGVILLGGYYILLAVGLGKFLIAVAISDEKKKDIKLLPYVLLLPLYRGCFQRVIRLFALSSEILFRHSFKDPFYPARVRRGTIHW
jgi:biofilm PGA synthesis N-glycosyltransferase PgaC